MNEVVNIIVLPIITGLLLLLVPTRLRLWKSVAAFVISIISMYFAISIWSLPVQIPGLNGTLPSIPVNVLGDDHSASASGFLTFHTDPLAKLIILLSAMFGVLISLYSMVYINRQKINGNYYGHFLITLGATSGAILSDNLILFLLFWGILGITLYKLIRGDNEESSAAAEKSLILIGASDGIMLLGIVIIWMIAHSLSMHEISLETNTVLSVAAFLALLTGCFTKAGAFPCHTWVPDYAQHAPASSSAFLPASLDKLLGIYFLARITTQLFTMNQWLTLLLMATGGITIITAVMMALVQHNYKKLLGYHAVSQVGYMILGFGLGSMIGVAAGLFHMINNALYKSGLFLSAGCIEFRTGKSDIDELGGLSKNMPVTFAAALIFAFSISGIPPLNGFASKWMIYQGITESADGTGIASRLWILWLGLAVLGSALTLASFIKFIGGIFLSRARNEWEHIREVPLPMQIPLAILALLCIGSGVFATTLVIPHLLMPVSGTFNLPGFWNPGLASVLIIVSILLGIIIYLSANIRNFRSEDSFIGGEKLQDKASFDTLQFYKTLEEFRFLSWCYRKAEHKWFDLYDILKKGVIRVSAQLSRAHSGLLHDYAIWILAGLLIMLVILI